MYDEAQKSIGSKLIDSLKGVGVMAAGAVSLVGVAALMNGYMSLLFKSGMWFNLTGSVGSDMCLFLAAGGMALAGVCGGFEMIKAPFQSEEYLARKEARRARKDEEKYRKGWEKEFRRSIYKNDPRYCKTLEQVQEIEKAAKVAAEKAEQERLAEAAAKDRIPVKLSAEFVKPASRAEFQVGDVAPEGDAHAGYIYGGLAPGDDKPVWFAMAPGIREYFKAAAWAKDQGGDLPTAAQAQYLDSLRDKGAFKDLFKEGSRGLITDFFLAKENYGTPVQSFYHSDRHNASIDSNYVVCVRR